MFKKYKINTKYRKIRDNFDVNMYDDLKKKRRIMEHFLCSPKISLLWDKAENFSIWDDNGDKFIDMTSGIFLANSGHANPKIIKAIQKCLKKKLVYSYYYNTKIRIEFEEKLLEISPKHFDRITLMCSGSEATDIAFKMIKVWGNQFEYPKRKHIISFKGSYHGRCLSSHFLSKGLENSKWSNMNGDVFFLDFPNDDKKFNEFNLPIFKEEIAAFFIETYQGWNVKFLPNEYMKDLYEFAKKNNILVCFDEVQSGFYRTGKLFGYQNYGDYLEPDIICLGKGISSSLPMAAVLSRKEIVDIDKNMDYSGTHSGDAICCYAAMANIEFLQEESFQKQLRKNIAIFQYMKMFKKYEIVKEVNIKGMVAAIIFENKEIAEKVCFELLNNGILSVFTGRESIKFGPPLTIAPNALWEFLEVLEKILIGNCK